MRYTKKAIIGLRSMPMDIGRTRRNGATVGSMMRPTNWTAGWWRGIWGIQERMTQTSSSNDHRLNRLLRT
ncbi:hypothetical protein D3C78_1789060 [compost metagenome]